MAHQEFKIEDVAKVYMRFGLTYVKTKEGKVYEVDDIKVIAKLDEVFHV